jgi:sugar phosphate permease
MVLLGFSQGHVFMPAQAAAFATISPEATGRAAAIFNAGRQLGGAISVAVLSTVISAVGAPHHVDGAVRPSASAYHAAFLTAAGIALDAAFWATAINDSDAAPTMRPQESRQSTRL